MGIDLQASIVLEPKSAERGVKLLHDPLRNKGTAFTAEEREALGLRGLLPPRVHSMELQVQRVMENIRIKSSDLERYVFLSALQDRNETLFYRVVMDHLKELMPIIYTPTVGEACQKFGHIFRRPRGLFLSAADRGSIRTVLDNWPHREVRIIVVTDGQRILGLGDLGADGMGIPIGKLALYTACAGINPAHCLPVTLDVGTENQDLLEDPLYIGSQHRRLTGEAYDSFVEEFMGAANDAFPGVVIQFEDFANHNAFRLLRAYQNKYCVFNDDIQGTASVTLAGVLSSLRITGKDLKDQNILFFGAGEAGIGIGHLIASAMVDEGLSLEAARQRCRFFDSKGLVVQSRSDLADHKRPFAHEADEMTDLHEAVKAIRPTMLIGVSGKPQTFTREIVETMSELNERPVIFALSNPTSKSECTAEQAYTWSNGKAVFASGSPFDMVERNGRTYLPGQANNAYIFPGLGLGLLVSGAERITDELFSVAARTLANQVTEADLEWGRIFPALARIREVSAEIAFDVASAVYRLKLTAEEPPEDLRKAIHQAMFEPTYSDYTAL
jgi:malate dehydrogenase (oxaloacetate-decarboxylating)(NADP+)